jgi:hypothetical protein
LAAAHPALHLLDDLAVDRRAVAGLDVEAKGEGSHGTELVY